MLNVGMATLKLDVSRLPVFAHRPNHNRKAPKGQQILSLHCTALHCIVLHYIVMYCTALNCTVLYCAVLHCTALHCTSSVMH